MKWSLWSDLHRRLAVYETAPVAAEAQRRKTNEEVRMQNEETSAFFIQPSSLKSGALTWICTTNFRLRRAACKTNYTLRAIGIEPPTGIRDRTRTD
jgi:hypothetical protein